MYAEKRIYEFMVKQGYERYFTDNRAHAVANARRQSEAVDHVVYVDDVEGNCVARAYCGFVELTA